MRDSSPYRKIAVASTFSPRFKQVLAEAKRIRERFSADLHLIYVGDGDEETAKKFSFRVTQRFIMKKEALQKLFWARWPAKKST